MKLVAALPLVIFALGSATTWLMAVEGFVVAELPTTNFSGILHDNKDESEDCSSDQEFVSPYEGRPRCCSVCEAGFGMIQLCTDTNETACGPCKTGKMFSDVRSARVKCKPCTVCQSLDPKAKVRRACSPKSDTECECIPGYFMAGQSCRLCTKCGPGSGAVSRCAWKTDTVCQPCKEGFYSDETAGTRACQACRACKSGEREVAPCTATSNRLCCDQPKCNLTALREADKVAAKPVDERGPLLTEDDRSREETWRTIAIYNSPRQNGTGGEVDDNSGKTTVTNTGLIPLYCAIMSLVIIVLVAYVVYKWWSRRHAAAASKATSSPGGSLLGTSGGPAAMFGAKRKAAAADSEGRINLMTYSKEGSPCGLISSNSPSHGTKRIADLSAKRMRQIELQLGQEKSGNGWSSLAKALDYSVAEISHFESQADLHRQPPVRFLLQDYAERPTATVAHMTKALQKCGRADVIPLLKEHGPRAVSTTVTATTPSNEPRQCMEMGQV